MQGALIFFCLLGDPGRVADARDADIWSFGPLREVTPPRVADESWTRGPVDRFILFELEGQDLVPNPPVERRRLIRRAALDLLGLAPSRTEVERFVADREPGAYERAIDRLLASPHYGERWGRHWLDVARFGESHGYESDDERPTGWTYRDAVIHALNEDLPFDVFVRWQLAGDQSGESHPLAVPLTGFLTAGPTVTNVDAVNREKAEYDKMDDIVATTGSAFLGLTIGCARCHDHKYDPISARDYYQLVGFFNGGKARDSSFSLDGQGKVKGLIWGGGGRKPNPILVRGDVGQKGEDVGAAALDVLGRPGAELDDRSGLARWITDIEDGAGALVARVIVNRLWQHHFGLGLVKTSNNFGSLGERPTHPDLLEWLAGELIRGEWRLKRMHRLLMTSAVYVQDTTWGVDRHEIDPENRLHWRRRARRLEGELIRDAILDTAGTLNRRIGGPSVKPWVSSEAIGTGSTNKWPTKVQDGPATWRRGLYVFMRRSMRMPFLETFDTPDAMSSRGNRDTTTVAPQALLLLNNRFVREQAEHFARRVGATSGKDSRLAVENAYWFALSRPPSSTEQELALEFLASEGQDLVNLCHALLTLSEFIYLD